MHILEFVQAQYKYITIGFLQIMQEKKQQIFLIRDKKKQEQQQQKKNKKWNLDQTHRKIISHLAECVCMT